MKTPADFKDIKRPKQPKISLARLIFRPLGYFALGLVWLIIFGMMAFCVWGLLPTLLTSDGTDLQHAGMFTQLQEDPSQIVPFIICLPLLFVIFGYFTYLVIAALARTVLSFTYTVRALRPSYKSEPLSTTRWSENGLGPIRAGQIPVLRESMQANMEVAGLARYKDVIGDAAHSLIPIRDTRFSTFWGALMIAGSGISSAKLLASLVIGAAYIWTIGWTLWPVHQPVLVILYLIVSVGLGVWGIWLIVRSIRREVRSWATEKPDSDD